MKALNSLIGSISAFAGILLILIFLVQAILVQDGFLNMTNSKYSVHKSLSMSEGDLQEVVHVMIAYVKGQIDSPDIKVSIHDKEVDFFNEKEVGHLADVRQVIQNFGVMEIILAIVCIVGEVFLVRKKAYKQMIRGVWYAWGILLVAAVVVGIAAVIDVNIIITVFHEV